MLERRYPRDEDDKPVAADGDVAAVADVGQGEEVLLGGGGPGMGLLTEGWTYNQRGLVSCFSLQTFFPLPSRPPAV